MGHGTQKLFIYHTQYRHGIACVALEAQVALGTRPTPGVCRLGNQTLVGDQTLLIYQQGKLTAKCRDQLPAMDHGGA
jgi:hypothetical protein